MLCYAAADTVPVAAARELYCDAVAALQTSFEMWGAASAAAVEKAYCALNCSSHAVCALDSNGEQRWRSCLLDSIALGSTGGKSEWFLVSSGQRCLALRMRKRPF